MKIEVRSTELELTPTERVDLEERIASGLGRFYEQIHVVRARVRDINGPRGGVDVACHLMIVARTGVTVLIDERAASLKAAVDVALDRATFNLTRALGRARNLRTGRERQVPAAREKGDSR